MRKAQFATVFSLALLGLVGGCLILSQGGFTSSGKRGDWSIFVPAPQAYVMAAIMFAQSILATLWLLQQVRATPSTWVLTVTGYCGAAFVLTRYIAS